MRKQYPQKKQKPTIQSIQVPVKLSVHQHRTAFLCDRQLHIDKRKLRRFYVL